MTGYDEEERLYELRWLDVEDSEDGAGAEVELPRLLVWFAGEDPFLLCERIVRALAAREAARLQLRLQLCVESMPPPEDGDGDGDGSGADGHLSSEWLTRIGCRLGLLGDADGMERRGGARPRWARVPPRAGWDDAPALLRTDRRSACCTSRRRNCRPRSRHTQAAAAATLAQAVLCRRRRAGGGGGARGLDAARAPRAGRRRRHARGSGVVRGAAAAGLAAPLDATLSAEEARASFKASPRRAARTSRTAGATGCAPSCSARREHGAAKGWCDHGIIETRTAPEAAAALPRAAPPDGGGARAKAGGVARAVERRSTRARAHA